MENEKEKAAGSEVQPAKKKPSSIPIYIAIAILIVFSGIFVLEFLQLSEGTGGTDDENLTAETYMDVVEPLLVDADPESGRELVELWGCNACHAGANAGRLAPAHAEVMQLAAERRPPLTAAAYVYESIIYPGAYTVEGYQGNMPRIYEQQMPEDELGDIIAYLISPLAEQD